MRAPGRNWSAAYRGLFVEFRVIGLEPGSGATIDVHSLRVLRQRHPKTDQARGSTARSRERASAMDARQARSDGGRSDDGHRAAGLVHERVAHRAEDQPRPAPPWPREPTTTSCASRDRSSSWCTARSRVTTRVTSTCGYFSDHPASRCASCSCSRRPGPRRGTGQRGSGRDRCPTRCAQRPGTRTGRPPPGRRTRSRPR